jgi:hypothetical protein
VKVPFEFWLGRAGFEQDLACKKTKNLDSSGPMVHQSDLGPGQGLIVGILKLGEHLYY